MSIETPYFKSFPEQWLSGDIYYESYELKGLFADAIQHYWASGCDLSYEKLLTRLNNRKDLLDLLIKKGIIKKSNNKININFQDEQKEVFEKRRKINSENGKKGGLAKARNSLSIKKREEKKREEFSDPNLKVSNEVLKMYNTFNNAQ
tara:strand:- start:2040 stop:2483 length:444 start_codon:yes stop_codon:yes gene_type:complete